jgi:hypothetical protein
MGLSDSLIKAQEQSGVDLGRKRYERSWCVGFFGVLRSAQNDGKNNDDGKNCDHRAGPRLRYLRAGKKVRKIVVR